MSTADHAHTHTHTHTPAHLRLPRVPQECAGAGESGPRCRGGAWGEGKPRAALVPLPDVRKGATGHRRDAADTAPRVARRPCWPLEPQKTGQSGRPRLLPRGPDVLTGQLPVRAGLPPSKSPRAPRGKSSPKLPSRPWSLRALVRGPGHSPPSHPILAVAPGPPRHSWCPGPGRPASLPWFRCCRSPRGRWCGGRGQRLHRLCRNWGDSTGRKGGVGGRWGQVRGRNRSPASSQTAGERPPGWSRLPATPPTPARPPPHLFCPFRRKCPEHSWPPSQFSQCPLTLTRGHTEGKRSAHRAALEGRKPRRPGRTRAECCGKAQSRTGGRGGRRGGHHEGSGTVSSPLIVCVECQLLVAQGWSCCAPHKPPLPPNTCDGGGLRVPLGGREPEPTSARRGDSHTSLSRGSVPMCQARPLLRGAPGTCPHCPEPPAILCVCSKLGRRLAALQRPHCPPGVLTPPTRRVHS